MVPTIISQYCKTLLTAIITLYYQQYEFEDISRMTNDFYDFKRISE